MDEFGLIRSFFAPLAKDFPGSLNLTDDAALIDVPAGQQMVVTKDAIVEGVHFLGSESPDLIARKLLRVNLSDLAAKGAKPLAYFLAIMLPRDAKSEWVEAFAKGLEQDQEQYGILLAGGDTTATTGVMSFSLTALGTVEKGKMLTRSGARPGDFIYVSGALGDSALGLASLQGKLPDLEPEDKAYLERRYLLPEPRLALGQALQGIATACMDISDGLVQDLGHLCAASGVRGEVEAQSIPASEAVWHAMEFSPALGMDIFTAGDDYELLFTAPPGSPVPQECTAIGIIREGSGAVVLDNYGKPMGFESKGYQHF